MVSPGVLGALAGFFGAVVTLGIPLVAFLRRLDHSTRRMERLLTGDDAVDGDGVLPRLDDQRDDLDDVDERLEAVERTQGHHGQILEDEIR